MVSNSELIRRVWSLSWPTVIWSALDASLGLADLVMVRSLGAEATAAVGISRQVTFLVDSVVLAIASGIIAVVSQAVGAKRWEIVNQVRRQSSLLHWHTNSDTLPDVSAAQTTIIPDWVTESPDPQTDATKILLSKLASGLQKNESITSAALSLSEDRNPQIAAYAMKLPVMLRRVDELAIMLMQSESQVVRRESMKGLEQILYPRISQMSCLTLA